LESKFIQTKDIRLHYLEWPSDGPPMVMLHGTGLCAQVWAPIAQALSSRFRVLAMDLRGHGASDKPQGQYRWEQVAGDLPAFIDALELDNVMLVGHSRGGGVSVFGGAQRPERLSGIVLIEPTISFGPRPGSISADGRNVNPMAERALKRRPVWASREEIFQSYHTRDPFKSWREDTLQAYIEGGTRVMEDGKVELQCAPQVEAQFYYGDIPSCMIDRVSHLKCPLLLVTRDSNHPFVLDSPVMQTLKNNAPTFRHILVPHTSHFVPEEQPDAVVSAICEFMGATPLST
jgi:pimeloyl-ACP methyl ester carboxylesterase